MPELDQDLLQRVVTRFNAVGGRCACAYELANEITAPHLSNRAKQDSILDVLRYLREQRQLELVTDNLDPFLALYSAPWTLSL